MQGRSSKTSDAVWKYSNAMARSLAEPHPGRTPSHLEDHTRPDQAARIVEHIAN